MTLTPEKWTQQETANFFEVPLSMVKKSIKTRRLKVLFGKPDPKIGTGLTITERDEIEAFYCSDEYSRVMPGQKDYVTVNQSYLFIFVIK